MKYFFQLLLFLCCCYSLKAQDKIILLNGDSLTNITILINCPQAVVISSTLYKDSIITIKKTRILKLVFADRHEELIDHQNQFETEMITFKGNRFIYHHLP